jgi:hypothetical protein
VARRRRPAGERRLLVVWQSLLLASCTARSATFTGLDGADPAAGDGAIDSTSDGATTHDTASADAALSACDPAAADLVACYDFEPASPLSLLVDGSMYGNTGTLAGVGHVSGRHGMAMQLSPTTSRVVVPDAGAINPAGTAGIVIGANSPCAAAPCADAFTGDIDLLRIWNRARTPAEICADAGQTSC